MTGRARAQTSADRRDAVVELAQDLHDLQSWLALDLMLFPVSIHHDHLRHQYLRPPSRLLVCRKLPGSTTTLAPRRARLEALGIEALCQKPRPRRNSPRLADAP